MGYEPIGLIPRYAINEVASVAEVCQPTQCNGSFILPFHAGLGVLPWLPIPAEGPITTIQLVGLLPSQQIARHVDAPITPAVRYHVVLRSNEGCWTFDTDRWFKPHEGMIYRMDPTQPHGAVNWGETIRLHLLIDVEG